MEYLVQIVLFIVIALLLKELFLDDLFSKQEKAPEKNYDDGGTYIVVEKKEHDFFGDKLAKNNPDKFHANVTEKRQQLDDGKIVGVNAAEAFYLLRNQKQQNLLVSEDGIMHWKDLKNAELNSKSCRIAL